MLYLIGKVTTKSCISDGHGLNGQSKAREGVAARLLLVRLALRSRGGDPDLAAGGPTKRNRTTGGQRDGQWEGEALTGRTSGSPTSR